MPQTGMVANRADALEFFQWIGGGPGVAVVDGVAVVGWVVDRVLDGCVVVAFVLLLLLLGVLLVAKAGAILELLLFRNLNSL